LGQLTGRDAAWSKDGQHLVFANGISLYVSDNTGASVRLIFTATGPVLSAHFSPEGERVRFTVDNESENTTAIWEVGTDGSQPHRVLGSWRYAQAACCGNWTADGRYYIFQVTQSSPVPLTTLWALADYEPAEPVQLTNGPTSFGSASPSAGGSKIWAIGVQPVAEAVKYSPERNNFVPLLTGISATDIDFSMDGKWVAYISVPEGELWRCRADGKDKLKLTSQPERAALPRWSPDGRQIAYVKASSGALKLAVMPSAGGQSQNILTEGRSQIDANWSADGKHIMFGSFAQDKDIAIRILDLSSHKTETVPGSEGLFSPRWSPDGHYVAALSPDFTKLMLFDFQTQKWTTWLTEPAGAVSYPV
jgi:Tol biopolymer transport system component